MKSEAPLEARIESLLREETAPTAQWQPLLRELYERYRTQEHLLARITRISDHFQRAERDRGQNYAEQLERKIRQIEKIVRISDRYQLMLHDLNERLTVISTHDELTGLPNRRFIQERLQQEIAKIERSGGTFSIALADIDHFKRVNDTAGHACGDRVLALLAQCLCNNLRQYDVCARWGGEEFLLFFPDCSLESAQLLAERICQAARTIDTTSLQTKLALSISIGVTEYCPAQGLDQALQQADLALYRAKSGGRDRVELHRKCDCCLDQPASSLP